MHNRRVHPDPAPGLLADGTLAETTPTGRLARWPLAYGAPSVFKDLWKLPRTEELKLHLKDFGAMEARIVAWHRDVIKRSRQSRGWRRHVRREKARARRTR